MISERSLSHIISKISSDMSCIRISDLFQISHLRYLSDIIPEISSNIIPSHHQTKLVLTPAIYRKYKCRYIHGVTHLVNPQILSLASTTQHSCQHPQSSRKYEEICTCTLTHLVNHQTLCLASTRKKVNFRKPTGNISKDTLMQ